MILLRDTNGYGWQLDIEIDGRVTWRQIEAIAAPPSVALNPLDGSTANSWQLGMALDNGQWKPTATAVAYSSANPVVIMNRAAVDWWFAVDASGRLVTVWAYGVGLPKIVYPSVVTGAAPNDQTTLYFHYPARFVPADSVAAVAHRNRASSGAQETLLERLDEFFEGTMEMVTAGTDLDAWKAFMRNAALLGIPFDYYTDSNEPDYTTYYLEDQAWKAAYKAPGRYQFKLQFYKYVDWT